LDIKVQRLGWGIGLFKPNRKETEMRITALVATGAVLASLLIASPAQANPKANGTCDKANSIAAASGKALKCTKNGKKLTWKQYSPKATSKDQVPMGASVRVGDWRISLKSVNSDVTEFICLENMFNQGCILNDDFEGAPDPDSDKRWVEFVLNMRNATKSDLSPNLADIGALNKGRVYWQGIFQPSVEEDSSSISLTPGGRADMSYYLLLDKNINPTVLAIKGDYFSNKAFYFKATK
jgi:hypothetical protein